MVVKIPSNSPDTKRRLTPPRVAPLTVCAHLFDAKSINKISISSSQVNMHCFSLRTLSRGENIVLHKALSFGVQITSYGLNTSMCTMHCSSLRTLSRGENIVLHKALSFGVQIIS